MTGHRNVYHKPNIFFLQTRTYLLLVEEAFLNKLVFIQSVTQFPSLYLNRCFVTVITKVHRSHINPTQAFPFNLLLTLISYSYLCLGLINRPLILHFTTRVLCVFLSFPLLSNFPAHLILHDQEPDSIWWGEEITKILIWPNFSSLLLLPPF
jgi:hypothetical protein